MIKHLDIINLSHYDIGFTDHPLVCRQLQTRYLDMALDLVRDNSARQPDKRFYWTCESNNAVLDWWQTASVERRDHLVQAVKAGWVEVCAMPFNQGPTMDARQWQRCAHWLPEDLWRAIRPRTIMQNDVNGFPRAGVLAFLDRGIEFLWMSLNVDTGGSPMPQPSPFWWQMPDGRRLFVWNSIKYPDGYFLFEAGEWRRGPLPLAADARYRPPREGDIFDASPQGLRRAHKICLAQLETWYGNGYRLERAAVPTCNMWRIDNDPPCALLPEFVAAWNAAGLTPTLAMTTPTKALEALREAAGDTAPTLSGEWVNWWANGVASTPHELTAARQAKRYLLALDSPLYPRTPQLNQVVETCARELCLFDEHTWGAWNSAARPDCLDTRGQYAEKATFAHRPLVMAELALGDANRLAAPTTPGIHIVNPYSWPFTGWVDFTDDCLRDDYQGVGDSATGQRLAFERLPGVAPFFTIPTRLDQFSRLDTARVFPDRIEGKLLRLWVENLAPHEIRSYRLRKRVRPTMNYAPPCKNMGLPQPEIVPDKTGWPASVRWPDVCLFTSPIGDFAALEFDGLSPRWTYKENLELPTPAERRVGRESHAAFRWATVEGPAAVRDTGPTLVVEQHLSHPRLRWLHRTVEIFKSTPRVRLQVTINRISKPESAEIFYVRFPLNCSGYDVRLSNGGLPFRPDQEQLSRTCRDYYAIDGRVVYSSSPAHVVLECHDTTLIALGGMNDGLGLEELEGDLATAYAILYNNIWYTNFAGDESGVMEFTFDIYAAEAADAGLAPNAFAVVNV